MSIMSLEKENKICFGIQEIEDRMNIVFILGKTLLNQVNMINSNEI
jgi:hypothetical protein